MTPRSQPVFTLKERFFAHLETWRPYTVLWCGLVSLAGACIAYGDFPPLKIAVLAFIIPMMGWLAGLYALDYFDRDLDRIQKPHRPIPSGRLSTKNAILVASILAVTGFLLSFLLGLPNIFLVFLVAITVLTYARVTKSRGILGNATRGLVTLFAFIYGVVSVQTTFLPFIIVLACVFLIHDMNSNLVGALRDKEGDAQGGYMTVPVQYGDRTSVGISLVLSVLWISIILLTIHIYPVVPYLTRFYIIFAGAMAILVGMYVFIGRSLTTFDRKKALRAHEFFVAERITLASSFIFGMVSSVVIPVTIFVIAISITLISQQLIRKQYEFEEIKN